MAHILEGHSHIPHVNKNNTIIISAANFVYTYLVAPSLDPLSSSKTYLGVIERSPCGGTHLAAKEQVKSAPAAPPPVPLRNPSYSSISSHRRPDFFPCLIMSFPSPLFITFMKVFEY